MKKLLSCLLLGAVCTLNVATAENSGEDKLNHFVNQVDSLQARFNQTVIDPQGQVIEQAEGTFQLQRPGKFRWDYQQPYPQQIVADGERIWFYDIDLEQVTVKSQSDVLSATPAGLLSGTSLPTEHYRITELPSEDGLQWVELRPKVAESSVRAITLAFSGDILQQMIMLDSFDQKTHLVFSRIRTNIEFDTKVFIFEPPAGVDVVGDNIP